MICRAGDSPPIFKEGVTMKNEWAEGLRVSAARMRETTENPRYGKVSEADFEKNFVIMELEDGAFWSGTSQDFEKRWEVAPV